MQLHAVKTFYHQREGLVTLEDDVLSIVSQVRELYGDRITIHLDPDSGEFVFVENCEDGTERLVFAVDELDARSLERLQRADAYSRGYEDVYARAEREQDEAHEQQRRSFRERMADHGERVAHALRRDGADSPMPLKVFIPGKGGWGKE